MHDAPEVWQGRDEKVRTERRTYSHTGTTVNGPQGSEFMDRDCSNREKVLPFRSATGAHMECGRLFLFNL
jgi:hypothetical protein